jgi:S-(hydroxymethyl)glutathione dehydrogenase/alcohol dehydrogenase
LHQLHGVRRRPTLLGPESTGTVVAAGSEVSHVAVGDTVLVTWVPRSRDEARQWNGGVRLDIGGGVMAGTTDVFTWADHTLVDQSLVVKAPDTIAKDVTAIIGVPSWPEPAPCSTPPASPVSVAVFVGGVELQRSSPRPALGRTPSSPSISIRRSQVARRFGATHGVDVRR